MRNIISNVFLPFDSSFVPVMIRGALPVRFYLRIYLGIISYQLIVFMTLLFYLPFYTSFRVIFKAFCSGLGVIYSQFLTNFMAVYLFRAKMLVTLLSNFMSQNNWLSLLIELYLLFLFLHL